MSHGPDRTFTADFRRFFLRGLAVLLPSVLTLWLVVYAYRFVDSAIAQPINGWIRMGMHELSPYWKPLRDGFDPEPPEVDAAVAAAGPKPPPREQVVLTLRKANIDRWWADRWYMNLIGLAVAIVAVYVAGRLLGGFLGRRVYRRLEDLITSLPILKHVYPSIKQIVDFVFSDEKQIKFSGVVLCEYPRRGVWSIGFRTGPSFRTIEEQAGPAVTVFIPSSPTPFTGYTIVVPCDQVISLPITVEEAVRYVVSGGVVVPERLTSLPHDQDAMLSASTPDRAPLATDVLAATAGAAAANDRK